MMVFPQATETGRDLKHFKANNNVPKPPTYHNGIMAGKLNGQIALVTPRG
jgi:hypothetical protein